MYASLEARLHDAFWDAEEGPGELALIEQFLSRHPGRCLELGCGSGRILLPLLAAGIDIEGLDLSPEMLRLCRVSAAARTLTPVLHEGCIEDLALSDPFAAVLIPAFTIQLVDDPSHALAAIRRSLVPGGGLYLTAFIPHAELSGDPPANRWYVDRELPLTPDTRAVVQTRHELETGRRLLVRHHRYEILDSSDTVLESHECTERIHWLEPHEWEALLTAHGFTITARIADFDPTGETPLEEATVFTLTARLAG